MGHVWLARDERSGLDVALKIVAREGKGGHRAEREARAAAALRHDRCQRILALARDPGHVYIAYEYVPGRTLREALRAGELDDRQAIEVAAQIADALAHAHGRGIVHRDVKPSNVLLAEGGPGAPGDGAIDARLLDFGLAQMAEFETLTGLGDIPGTLAYISPERLRGELATPAADVWAVGVVLWEALAGRHPFWNGDLTDTSRLIRAGAPPLEDYRPDLPRHVLQTVTASLTAAPADRPAAGRLADELRSLGGRRRKQGSGGSGEGDGRRPRLSRLAVPAVPALPSAATLAVRAVPAGLAALTVGWITSRLAFYPGGWPIMLAALAGGLGLAAPRAAVLFTLVIAFFPLANISIGLAAVYAAVAALWAALTWRDARSSLLLTVGPLLAPLAALALLPLAVQGAHGRWRRALQAAAAVLLAAIVAGLRRAALPFDGSSPPLGLGIAGSTSPTAVASSLMAELGRHPELLGEAAVLGVAAAALPLVRGRGPWPAAFYGAALLAATALIAPSAAVLPLIAAAWISAAALALHPRP
jgi:Protein kinase domain